MIQSSFAYNGKDFSLIGDTTAVQICGSSIVLWHTDTNEKEYLWSKRNGYSMVTASYTSGLIAAAEYGLKPECHIYSYPGKMDKPVHSFPIDTTVKCMAMAFSRDSSQLLLLGSAPDFRISIFDLTAGKKIAIPETKLPCKPSEFVQILFNPMNKNKFIILSQTTLYCYMLHPAFEEYSEGAGPDKPSRLRESFRLECNTFKPEDPQLTMTRATWDPYNRVHVCTDKPMFMTINTKTAELETTITTSSRPCTLLLTQKHAVVSLEEGMLQWLKLEAPPEMVVAGDKDADQALKIFENEIEQEWAFGKTIGESEDLNDYISYLHYSRTFQVLVCGTESGVFGKLEVAAEAFTEEDDEDEGQQAKEKTTLQNPFVELGRFHTQRVTGLRELGDTTQLVTTSDDHYMNVWEATTQEVLASVFQPARPTGLDTSKDGTAAFVGTAQGAFRVYDVRTRDRPRLVQQLRFFEDPVPIDLIRASRDGRSVLVASTQGNQVFVISQKADDGYRVLGYFNFPGRVVSACHAKIDGTLRLLVLLHNNLLATAFVPTSQAENPLEPIPEEDSRARFRIVDRGSTLVMYCEATNAVLVCGSDKLLKQYKLPMDGLDKLEWRKAPDGPVEEMQSHAVATTCWHESTEFKFFVTGGKDGQIILRNVSNFGQMNSPIKAHGVATGGVTALCFSQTRSTVYSAGGDGTVMAWTVGGKPNPQKPITGDASIGLALNNMEQVERVPGSQIKLYKQILTEELEQQQAASKQAFKESMAGELAKIRAGLMALLAENERVTDIERLDRDEFVIDLTRKTSVEESGTAECDKIRSEAKKTVSKFSLLWERLKAKTWDTMEDDAQLKAVQSIMQPKLVYNYPLRKRTPAESRRLNMVIYARKIELNEQLMNLEHDLVDALNDGMFSKRDNGEDGGVDREFVEQYFMNRVRGTHRYPEDGSIKEAAEEYVVREMEKKARKEKDMMANTTQGANAQAKGMKPRPKIKITKGKLLAKKKKTDDDDDEAARLAALKKSDIQIKSMEEFHWKVSFKIQALDVLRRKIEQDGKGAAPDKKKGDKEEHGPLNIMDLLYEPFELVTDVRKRNQIELIKGVVFVLKAQFNEEFKKLEGRKQEDIGVIEDKNTQIAELLEALGTTEERYTPEAHPEEHPERVLVVKDEEVPVERYLTAAQRAELEEQARKQAELEAALKGDNVGQRGLMSMLGTTELIQKKEKSGAEFEVVRQDWMDKPEEEMTEEEVTQLREYERQLEEFKVKQRKAREQELKKIKADIHEIRMRFEEEVRRLFKRKLFFDARVLEQELFLVRLVVMLHTGKETRLDEKKYRREIARLEAEKAQQDELIASLGTVLNDQEQQLQNNDRIKDQERVLKRDFAEYASQIKAIMAFVRQGKAKRPGQSEEVKAREAELSQDIVDLDPFSKADKLRVKELLKEEEEREHYDYEKDRIGDMGEADFEKLQQERATRVEMDKAKEAVEKKMATLQDHITYLEEGYATLDDTYRAQVAGQKKAAERINKNRYNFECVVYIRQGQVEVPPLPVATDYKDAILIQKSIIDAENRAIGEKGDKKVTLLKNIADFKTKLRRVNFQKQRLDLEIENFRERAMDVQMYRVTKQTQEIIQGKHQKKDEDDKKRLENQISQLLMQTEERIKTINRTRAKKQREINEKRDESDELDGKARELKTNVEQRMQIINLKSNTQQSDEGDPSKKIKEIAHKRKLLDILKQQTEEMEVLRDELDRLRAKTFPSFAHLHNKPGYPDEN